MGVLLDEAISKSNSDLRFKVAVAVSPISKSKIFGESNTSQTSVRL